MSESIRFQNYELLRREDGSIFELGRGAMGVTYKALDTDLHCHVALKVIGPGVLGSEEARERFIREARAAAKLHHPNIATVFRLGRSDDDTHFYAMEFCDGPTLEQALAARGPFAAGEALGIARQVCKALMQAEQHHLLHRDLKPSNLILTTRPDEGTVVKVIDFGLAKSLADGQQSLASRGVGGFVGTAHFASPEQLEEHDLDIRSDIYSLGVCLWFMLEGRPPFAGSLARVMSQALAVEPPWERLAGHPAAVIALLRRLLAKDREARPRAALALRQELDECLHAIDSAGPATDTPTVAAPPRAPASASPFATRFQISERLGRDALGRIFRATDRESSGALVAYHVIDPALLSVPATRRGLEAQLTAARGHPHPHLANVLAFSSTPPSLAFATEWINGFSLLDLLKERGALLPFEVVRLLTPLAAAADHASRHGIHGVPLSKQQVHLHFPRGLSKNERPTVLAAPFEGWPPHAVKAEVLALSDGAAAVAGGMQSMMTFVPARSGNRAGTPTAVPALASLACELLGAHIGTTFAPIARLSEAGNAVLRRALTEDQAFPNASAFTQALAAAIGKTGPTSPPKKRAPHSSSPPAKPSRFGQSVGATLLVLALTAAAFGYYHGIHQPRQRDREKRLADAEAPERKMREPEELRSATVPEQTEAPTHIADPSPAPVSPSPAQPAAAPSSLPAKVAKPRFVLRHKFPAVAGSGSGEYGKQFGDDFVFSPNGRWIAVRDREKDQQTIRAWDLETGTSPWMINRRQRPMLHFGFSPDSRWFVVAGGDYGDLLVFRGEVLFAHAATGRVFAHHHGEADLFSSSGFLFSPNSESLITWSG
ncbi:MAG: hypothetical protein JWQ44_2104, partial [Chthoniobacter sp.]|nr:hypothetical protein [Chthoniobacter sp.]